MPTIPSEMELEKRRNEGKRYERPNFGENQIRDLKGLKPSLVVIKMPEVISIKILTKPHKDKNGNWWIQVKVQDKEPEGMNLAEVGIVPYPSGMWNNQNWLSKS